MSIFTYTLPSGSTYELQAPAGTTQAQADEVFYTQVAAGSLVGYSPGQVLQSTETLIQNFELSRLERGTAGVDLVTVMALNEGLPVIATVPSLNGVPVSNAVSESDVALMRYGLGPESVGVLSPIEVQTLQAQLAAQVGQAYDVISIERGIGMFGFSSWQLEQLGYLKPGTTATYLNSTDTLVNPPNFIDVMRSPTVWTGLNGVTGVDQILSSPELQVKMQTALMKQSYNSLQAAGLITETNSQTLSAMTGQVYSATSSNTGVFQPIGGVNLLTKSATSLAELTPAAAESFISSALKDPAYLSSLQPSNVQSMLNGIVSNPSLISNLSPDKLSAFSKSISDYISGLPDITNTVLKPMMTGVTNGPSLSGLANQLRSMAQSGQSLLSSSQNVSGLLSNGQNLLSKGDSLIAQGKTLATQVQGQVGSLVNNASKFGTQATEMWNKGVQGNLKDAMDNVGKMGDYAVKFAKEKVSGLVSSVKSAAGFTNTINRATLDTAVDKIIGTPSITPPKFTMPNSLSDLTDVKYAQNMLSEAKATYSQVQNEVGTRIAAAQNLAGEVQGQISQVTGAVTSVANQATGIVTGVKSQIAPVTGIISRIGRLG